MISSNWFLTVILCDLCRIKKITIMFLQKKNLLYLLLQLKMTQMYLRHQLVEGGEVEAGEGQEVEAVEEEEGVGVGEGEGEEAREGEVPMRLNHLSQWSIQIGSFD